MKGKRRRRQKSQAAGEEQIELADLQQPLATEARPVSTASTPEQPEDLPESEQPLGQLDDPIETTAGSPEPGRADEEALEEQPSQQTSCCSRLLAGLLFLIGLIAILFKMTLGANDIVTDLLAGMSYLSGGESICEYRFPEFF